MHSREFRIMKFNKIVGILYIKMRVFFKADNIICLLNTISFFVFLAYLYSMFIHPFWEGNWNWQYVQSVWYAWQALNVGMLAFGSSIIAFNISRYHAAKQLEREFIAAKSFLPQALSDLCGYFKSCAPVLIESFQKSKDRKLKKQDLKSTIPNIPDSYIPVFKECIKSASPEVATYLANILTLLQVHDARMRSIPTESVGNPSYRKSCLYSLAELQVLVNSLFNFARSEEGFSECTYTVDQFSTALRNLGVVGDEHDELLEYVNTKKWV
jgi:hypothetical protein